MKSLNNIFNIVCDLLQPGPSLDRVSLDMVRFDAPETAKVSKKAVASYIPRDYLYYQVHEIEDDTWNYIATVHASDVNLEEVA